MTNPFTLGFIVFIFVASNGVILVMTALPRSFGEIPRWYWPITVGVVIGAAMFYWGILRLLMVPWGRDGRILGSILGFEPHIYESDATDFPDDDRFLMLEARHEGTSRLIIYKVSNSSFLASTSATQQYSQIVSRSLAPQKHCTMDTNQLFDSFSDFWLDEIETLVFLCGTKEFHESLLP